MLDKRTKGLLVLHGCISLCTIPVLFCGMAVFGVEVAKTMRYSLVNFPLYIFAIVVAGVVHFNFYSILGPSLSRRDRSRVFHVANLQISTLALLLFGVVFATKDQSISRLFIGLFLSAAYIAYILLNVFLPEYLSRFVFDLNNRRNCILVGNSNSVRRLDTWLKGKEKLGLNVVGLINFGETNPAKLNMPILGIVAQLERCIRQHEVHQVILLETRHSKDWVQEILKTCEREGCQIMIYNPWADYFDYPLYSVREGEHTFFMIREEPLESPINRLIKRIVDLAIATPVVLIAFPIMVPVVWFFQRRQSPGPIFYKQTRCGYNRREFVLYKFRTMHYRNGSRDAQQATRGDERIFHFGLFMRRTSLDEFPQFLNVLRGDMSVVGPRPHLPEHDLAFSKEVQLYPQRHVVKPGITGLAQCKGFRGEITEVDLLRKRVQCDLEYIEEWSLWMDFEIILQTARIVLHPPETAY